MNATAKHVAVAVTLSAAALLGAASALATPAAEVPCQYEDGNPDGVPCTWTDPDTGTRYWVSSENYR
ncbi:hypothetical protein K1X22_01275 [Mycolicibacterium farcinogenes]|uniref:hypothetical protein n=1 Tax=Mycolicibacterium farcinogenes TaxID=1802 RepID=UPI001C8F1360|nr:hypothetical protein [Mycolicibacterium farcinogenes]QZH63423.1 hypothetical protein K1X22_01275 [Mycolicibacterium farcinogenes]